MNTEYSIFASILADIKQNPMILQNKKKPEKLKTRERIWFDYTTKVYQNHKDLINVLRRQQEVENLKRIKDEAVKLGVELSYLVTESMYFATNDFLAIVVEQFISEEKNEEGIVVANLTAVFEILKITCPREKPNIEYNIPIKRFFVLFKGAIKVLERIISSIHEFSSEKLSVLESDIENCNKRLMKINKAINEVKRIYVESLKDKERNVAKRIEMDREYYRDLLKEGLFFLWNSLFHSKGKHI